MKFIVWHAILRIKEYDQTSDKSKYFNFTSDPEILHQHYAEKRLWQGIPSIGMWKGGRIFAVFYSGGIRENVGNASFIIMSDDDEKTWPHRLLLDDRNEVSYPDAVEHNGFIYIIYDRERGDVKRSLDQVYGDAREILMAKGSEEDILAGKIVNHDNRLRVIINKLSKSKPPLGVAVLIRR